MSEPVSPRLRGTELCRAGAPRCYHVLWLQGHGRGPTERFWVGLSCYLPGGGADGSPTREERSTWSSTAS
jgi:hypothetical protein